MAKKQIREAVFRRDGGCLLSPFGTRNPDGMEWGACLGPLTYHHLRKASQGGEYSIENGATLCSMHNGLVEDFPKAAHAIGLVIRSGEVLDNQWTDN